MPTIVEQMGDATNVSSYVPVRSTKGGVRGGRGGWGVTGEADVGSEARFAPPHPHSIATAINTGAIILIMDALATATLPRQALRIRCRLTQSDMAGFRYMAGVVTNMVECRRGRVLNRG